VNKKDLIRTQAEGSLESFIRLVHPNRVLGGVHSELCSWLTREDGGTHKLVLLPRDHQKSTIVGGYKTAWMITTRPDIRILYISSTTTLATKMLGFIKGILTSPIYRFYWPEMVNDDEMKREKWTETELAVDHPLRRAESIREPTVFTAGLTTNIVGLHADHIVMDDVVTAQNSLTPDGRDKIEQQYSLLASILSTDSTLDAVGTRYFPTDLYGTLLARKVQLFNSEGEFVDEHPLYEDFTRQVENVGDGSGEFLWPRQQRKDGRWFGFDQSILASKKAQYLDQIQFRAQYYNDPSPSGASGISKEHFQYYDRSFLKPKDGVWTIKGQRLNVFAAIDFAYTLKKNSDFSSIVVVGVDSKLNYYVLDIDRFKTDLISEYFDHLLRLYQKWGFRKIRAETTAAQSVIVNDLKMSYIRTHGLALAIDEVKPNRYLGAKPERIAAVLQPRYANKQMWHYLGGNCQILEEELEQYNPSHDDVKDALASAVDVAIAPAGNTRSMSFENYRQHTHSRFGGIS
jgi:hypothetical protein